MTFDLRAVTAMIGTWRESSASAGRRCHGRVLLWAAALAGSAMMLAPVRAHAALPICQQGPNNINRCCKITSSGYYSLGSGFHAKGYGACIRIKASHVFLSGQGYDILGPGGNTTMKGVVVESGANRTTVQSFGYINGFATSIEMDANQANLGEITAENSGTGVVINGNHALLAYVGGDYNVHNGVVINGRGSIDYFVGGSFNGGNGVVVNSTAVGTYMWHSVDSENNHAGLKIKAVTSGFFDVANSTQNKTYGIWLRGSSNVSLLDFFAYENTIAGVYLGCHGQGPADTPCPWGTPPTNANMLVSSASPLSSTYYATANGGNVQQYGVVIDAGNHLNHVLHVQAIGNTKDDAYDGNPGCGGNVWFNFDLGLTHFQHCYSY